ncbi:MAG: hypothetical protein QOD03_481 [Verrucomicrobiota bacterium]|jgi:hypothetical protein
MKSIETGGMEGVSFRCETCQRQILDGGWFARILTDKGRVLFCSPRCVESFLTSSAQDSKQTVVH